jgi:alanyl-tRNA synthetase
VVLLGTKLGADKVSLVAGVSDNLAKRFNSGAIVKEAAAICGGSGGGRPNLAQAGGKDPTKLSEALRKGEQIIKDTK